MWDRPLLMMRQAKGRKEEEGELRMQDDEIW
jgi:hypothetical protein